MLCIATKVPLGYGRLASMCDCSSADAHLPEPPEPMSLLKGIGHLRPDEPDEGSTTNTELGTMTPKDDSAALTKFSSIQTS